MVKLLNCSILKITLVYFDLEVGNANSMHLALIETIELLELNKNIKYFKLLIVVVV